MSVMIRAENLSKKFVIGHEQQERYSTLRDIVANKVKNIFSSDRSSHTTEEFWALKNVSFEIKQGDRVGLIGRNGAGKSTLLKLLSRISEPTEGRISLYGRIASLLEVGTGFHPELTGRENVFLNGAILGMSRVEIRKKFDEIVAFAEVEKFLDTPVKRYSSGMYVRLAFAVAAHLEPEILIVDEVLAVGDMEFQKKCIGKMEDVSKNEGRTVIFVSHNMGVIKTLCNSGILLSKGQVMDAGSLDVLIPKYLETAKDISSSEYYHREGGKLFRIEKVKVNMGQDMGLKMLSTFVISIKYDAFEFRDKCEFFVLIYDSEGNCVQSAFQEDQDMLADITDRLGEIQLKITNNLIPGKYFLSVGCFTKRREFLDWVEFCETFDVDGVYDDNRLYRKRLGNSLAINPEWTQLG
jgi:lipopolysaccharide transport system ATP-binding protein